MSQISIAELVDKVLKGDFPDCQRPNQEVLIGINDQLVINYSLILANALFNGIPAENAEEIYPRRQQFYDAVMQIVNTFRIGRLGRLIAELDGLINSFNNDPVMWPSSRKKANICSFVVDYFVWSDEQRFRSFFGINPEVEDAQADAEVDCEE